MFNFKAKPSKRSRVNRVSKPMSRAKVLTLIGIIIFIVLASVLVFTYSRLNSIWLEQFVITDSAKQVTITSGNIPREIFIEHFRLHKGANIEKIDFAKARDIALKKYPNIKTLSVARRMPKNIEIKCEERNPVVRLKKNNIQGRVADSEGIVFEAFRGTKLLPFIQEPPNSNVKPGERLGPSVLAALELIETAKNDKSLVALGQIIHVDAAKDEYLTAMILLKDYYYNLKIAWPGMLERTPESHLALVNRLKNVIKTIELTERPKTINATVTEFDRITVDIGVEKL